MRTPSNFKLNITRVKLIDLFSMPFSKQTTISLPYKTKEKKPLIPPTPKKPNRNMFWSCSNGKA